MRGATRILSTSATSAGRHKFHNLTARDPRQPGPGFNRNRPCTVRVVISTSVPSGMYRSLRAMYQGRRTDANLVENLRGTWNGGSRIYVAPGMGNGRESGREFTWHLEWQVENLRGTWNGGDSLPGAERDLPRRPYRVAVAGGDRSAGLDDLRRVDRPVRSRRACPVLNLRPHHPRNPRDSLRGFCRSSALEPCYGREEERNSLSLPPPSRSTSGRGRERLCEGRVQQPRPYQTSRDRRIE